jgi:hypothetical protein
LAMNQENLRALKESRYRVSYGSGLEIEWSGWELAKIAEIKNRRNLKPLRTDAIRCAWSGCNRGALKDRDYCWKHEKLMRVLHDHQRDY